MNRRSFIQMLAGVAACVAVERVVKPVYFDFGRFQPRRKLKARWTFESEQDLQNFHGLLGYRGEEFLKTGYIYAPFMPLYVSPPRDPVAERKEWLKKYSNAELFSIARDRSYLDMVAKGS